MQSSLIRIAERATTLDERIDGDLVTCVDDSDTSSARRRLTDWKKSSAYGDDRLFEKRLLFDGIDLHNAERLIGSVKWKNPENPPAWLRTLEQIIESTDFIETSGSKSGVRPSLAADSKQPFQEILVPFVSVAHKKLEKVCRHMHLITPGAFELLQRRLLVKLSGICSRPLVLELNIARLQGTLIGETSRDRYFDFLKKIAAPDSMLAFFCEYSVAGRLMATQVDQWIDSTTEFLSRLFHDLPEITKRFANGNPPGNIVSLVDHLSDPHCGGRTSKRVTFASGLKLIYKPKNLIVDEAFQKLLEWMNATEELPRLKAFAVLPRTTHGWVEFLEPFTCEDPQQMKSYFQRTGMLLCLLHVLGANDCHMENLFACGEHPVFVDLETLLEVRPAPPGNKPLNSEDVADELTRLSLLHTGMLPTWIFGEAEVAGADFSGLMGGTAQQAPYRVPEWIDSETDEMRLGFKYVTLDSTPNQPKLRGNPTPVSQYQKQIEEGFKQMYNFLMKSREVLLKNGHLDHLLAGRVRYLQRATAEYALILQKSLNPRFLKEGIDRSIHLDLLCRNLFLKNREHSWKLIQPERQALERLDIPYFTAEANCNVLFSNLEDMVVGVELASTRDRLHQRFADLNTNEMEKQLMYFRAAISLRSDRRLRQISTLEIADAPLPRKAEWIQKAASIGDALKSWAIQAPDGSVTWIGADYIPHLNQFIISPIQNTFYSGKSGIAFFLAALNRFVPDRGYGSLALAAVQTVRETLLGEKAFIQARAMQLGAMSGIASICWTLQRIGVLLEENELIKDAASIGLMITPERISMDRHLDFVGGSSGAILSLLSLHHSFPEAGFLSRAEECGKHLLENSIRCGSQTRCWPTVRGEKLTGFSHGTAGYAYALFRLFEATTKEEYRDAAMQAFRYETSLFSDSHQNWPDLRSHDGIGESSFMTGWCHGAPGITLARIGCASKMEDHKIAEEIETGLNTTIREGIQPQDDICCGNFSRIETLLIASKRMQRPDLCDSALKIASRVASLASENGAFRLDPDIRDGVINPGFMKGISGIGFGLLRLADTEDSLPSPLLM